MNLDNALIQIPVVTKKRFSELTGLGIDVVRGMVEKEHLPSIKIGRHRMVNFSLLREYCLEAEN